MSLIQDTANAISEKYGWEIVAIDPALNTITVEKNGNTDVLSAFVAIAIARDQLQIGRIQQLKLRLENQILNALNQFEERTTLSPTGISLSHGTVDDATRVTAVRVRIDTQL